MWQKHLNSQNIRGMSTQVLPTIDSSKLASLHPWFVTGFADGESSFCISIYKSDSIKIGWRIQASFQIGLHIKDQNLLESIKLFFGVGNIYIHGKDSIIYQVGSLKDLEIIIAHFDKYPLQTQKRADFELFKKIVEIIKNKNHTTFEGLQEIIGLKSSLNNGLPIAIKEAFPEIISAPRPLVVGQEIKDQNWLSGFVSAEGCFNVKINKYSSGGEQRESVILRFTITQNTRDEQLLRSLINYLDCGNVSSQPSQDIVNFIVTKYSDIVEKIIPFFSKYKIEGVKVLDFKDFCKIAELKKIQADKTSEGLIQIHEIKSGMNKSRLTNRISGIRQMSTLASIHLNNNLSIRHNSTLASNDCKIKPWFLTGFADAEGCFMINILKVPQMKIGWRVQPVFQIRLHAKDENLLKEIKAFFEDQGYLTKSNNNSVLYRVFSIEMLEKIINHFDKYPLQTQKRADFELFKSVVMMVKSKKHLSQDGLQEIINHRASLNNGLTLLLKESFPKSNPVARISSIENPQIPDPQWLAGFTAGEGSFSINVSNNSASKTGYLVSLRFQLSQHLRDEKLLKSFIDYFGCGQYYSLKGSQSRGDFVVTKLSDILNIIIPFYLNNPIIGLKAYDFQLWCKVSELMLKKEHLTLEGLEKIREIKAKINKYPSGSK